MGAWGKWGSSKSGTAGGKERGHCLLLPLSSLGRAQGHEEGGGHPGGPGKQADLQAYRCGGSPGQWGKKLSSQDRQEGQPEWPGQGLQDQAEEPGRMGWRNTEVLRHGF